MWTEQPSAKSKKPVNKDRFISKMFLRCVHLASDLLLLGCCLSFAVGADDSLQPADAAIC